MRALLHVATHVIVSGGFACLVGERTLVPLEFKLHTSSLCEISYLAKIIKSAPVDFSIVGIS